MVRYLTKEIQDEISKTSEENRIKDLSKVWKIIQQKEIWEQVRGLYSLESKKILFQTMQLYSTKNNPQVELSPFSEKFSEKTLRELQKYGEFRCSPQGRELEKQRQEQYPNLVPQLPHEVALAAKRYTRAISEFTTWHRNESIKAYGNAIVPQVALQIFRAIKQYEQYITQENHP